MTPEEPKPWQWPQLPNPFANTPPPQGESPTLGQSQAAAASPMPASLTQQPSSSAQQTASTGLQSAERAESAAQNAQAAQHREQPFWVLPPWRHRGSEGAVVGSPEKPVAEAGGLNDISRAGSGKQLGPKFKLPRLRNPFEGWGQSVAPGEV